MDALRDHVAVHRDGDAPAGMGASGPPFAGENGAETSLGYLDGENARGDWTLRVTDSAAGATGTLNCWCLEIDGRVCTDELLLEHVSGNETFSPIVVGETSAIDIGLWHPLWSDPDELAATSLAFLRARLAETVAS